ncbi:MAG: glycosyltransferase [Calditrichaeota bacterium]|nr:MAG: glycosyltransferase [Calditrichota bacterium]
MQKSPTSIYPPIDLVIPMYNEEKNIPLLVKHIITHFTPYFEQICFILVDDGSKDNTYEAISEIEIQSEKIKIDYIRLARNFGKDLAIKCGLDHSTSPLCAIIDADFQHPPEKILEAVEAIQQGVDVVHIVKKEYNFGPKYRKYGSKFFHKLVNFLSDYEIHLTDFKVLNQKAVERLRPFSENYYFSRGIIDFIGLRTTKIEYEPQERKFGESKYSFFSLLRLAVNSMMAVSVKPLRISIYVGLMISIFSFLYGLYILGEKIFLGQPIPGFATLGTALFFLGGIQLLFLGIIGEYLGKTFIESKRRPQYIIDYIQEISPEKK